MPWLCITLIAAALVINEVLYDPEGADAGHEFVELFNAAPEPFDLNAVTLFFINGADPGARRLVWWGEPGVMVEARGFFVLGEDRVGARDRTVDLGLQNGDEAIVLEREGVVLDAVAWGTLGGLGEGDPGPAVAGTSLGRVPDGADSGDNRTDFEELPSPNPGAPNRPAQGLELVAWWPEPVWREEPGHVVLQVRLAATGWQSQQEGVAELWGQAHRVRLGRGEEAALSFARDLAIGSSAPVLRITTQDEEGMPGALPIRCGVAELVFTEVQVRPGEGEPEWFEILHRGDRDLPLEGWAYRDRGGRARLLDTARVVAPGMRVVFTADPAVLTDRHPSLAGQVLGPSGGWATLNDTDPGGGVAADSLHLIAPDGAVVDLVTWRRADIEERGRSLQRSRVEPGVGSIWLPSLARPTPGEAGTEESRPWPERGLRCHPDPFTPDGDGVDDVLEVLVLLAGVRRVTVFDLQGDPVRDLETVGSGGRIAARWDGTDQRGRPVPAGAWVVVAEPADGGAILRQVVGLGRLR